MKIKELEMNKEMQINLLIKEATEKETSAKKPYMLLLLTDGTEDIQANMWDTTAATLGFKQGEVVCATVTKTLYKEKPSYTVKAMVKPMDNVDANAFVKTVPMEPAKMYAEMVDVIKGFKNNNLLRLTGVLIQEHKEQLLKWSAAKAVHHNLKGGLIYHMYRMMKAAIALCEVYPTVNKDLLVAGAIVHDIGKLKELETDEMGAAAYTKSGLLFGHLYMGARMVEELAVARGIDTQSEEVLMLTHLIVSHHGTLEMGAIAKPATLEAMLLHQLDMVDSRVYQYEEIYEKQENGEFTKERMFFLDNTQVYKHNL